MEMVWRRNRILPSARPVLFVISLVWRRDVLELVDLSLVYGVVAQHCFAPEPAANAGGVGRCCRAAVIILNTYCMPDDVAHGLKRPHRQTRRLWLAKLLEQANKMPGCSVHPEFLTMDWLNKCEPRPEGFSWQKALTHREFRR